MTRWAWTVAVLPYAVLAGTLTQVVPPASAIGNAALLLGLMLAHAWCYRLWRPAAPRRIVVNELLARAWFAVYLLVLVGLQDGDLGWAALGLPWAVLAWLVHVRLLRKGYDWASNVAQLGVFLAGLAVLLGTALR